MTVPTDSSLSGEALRSGEAFTVADLATDSRVRGAVKDLGFGPAAIVPLTTKSGQMGVLVVARERFAAPFTSAQVTLIGVFAAQAAVALSYGQIRAELEDMRRLEDRERIAQSMHDVVIQRLFATGLVLEGTAALIERPDAQERLLRAVDDLDETIRAIRTTIFELKKGESVRPGIRAEILDVIAEAGTSLGFEPVVSFVGPIDTIVSAEDSAQLLLTLREALLNAGRHARVSRVEVSLETSDGLALVVTDNGMGVPYLTSSAAHDLQSMRERAVALGGTLELIANPDGGAALTWRVPSTG
jgi:signal transduction histidine kinase